ncbi:hypothetical protein JTB14_008013 [Gonioctena quinquepunctata]|nr:hypothetical protein JTB14_008013 [Gonioctena quinquepunctata]
MPDNGDTSDREELQGATGFEEGLTGLRDNPAGGEFLERELGSDDFLAPPEVKAGWIYRLKNPELMELASSLQINSEGTVIELRRRLIWHLVELPKARGTSTSLTKELGRILIRWADKIPELCQGGISAIYRHIKQTFRTHGGVRE